MASQRAARTKEIAGLMADLDLCMFTTRSLDGQLNARPMSNNGEVEFDGDVWFFSAADSRKIREIEADPIVHLAYSDMEQFRFISMSGVAEIVTDAEKKRELWLPELERWFEDGPDSEDLVLIKVAPGTLHYWNGEGEGEIKLDS